MWFFWTKIIDWTNSEFRKCRCKYGDFMKLTQFIVIGALSALCLSSQAEPAPSAEVSMSKAPLEGAALPQAKCTDRVAECSPCTQQPKPRSEQPKVKCERPKPPKCEEPKPKCERPKPPKCEEPKCEKKPKCKTPSRCEECQKQPGQSKCKSAARKVVEGT